MGSASHVPSTSDVVEALDDGVARLGDANSRLGSFAAVYRTVTATVREGLDAGFFDDGERMEHLDSTWRSPIAIWRRWTLSSTIAS